MNIRAQFVEKLKKTFKEETYGKTLLSYGHWFQTVFPAKNIKKQVEYINIVRECTARTRSNFLFDLKVKSLGINVFEEEKNVDPKRKRRNEGKFLKTTLPTDACIDSYECLKGSDYFDVHLHSGAWLVKFLCGDLCESASKRSGVGNPLLEGALRNIDNFKTFTVLGTTEHFVEYLDMLECAYPSVRGIVKLYESKDVKRNKNNAEEVKSDALARILNETCANNLYVPVYKKILERSLGRYEMMMKKGGNRGECCRLEYPNVGS